MQKPSDGIYSLLYSCSEIYFGLFLSIRLILYHPVDVPVLKTFFPQSCDYNLCDFSNLELISYILHWTAFNFHRHNHPGFSLWCCSTDHYTHTQTHQGKKREICSIANSNKICVQFPILAFITVQVIIVLLFYDLRNFYNSEPINESPSNVCR